MENLLKTPIAHRGLHGGPIPENSLAAFRAAVGKGFPIETDVRFTADGQLVVFHDDTLARMTGDPRAVSDCTLAELKRLRLGGSEETIPTFREFLGAVGGKVPLLLEIKNMEGVKGERIARAMEAELEGYAGGYAVQSFQPLYVKAYKRLRPGIPCGLLTAKKLDLSGFSPPFARIKRAVVTRMALNFWVKPDFISADYRAVTKKAERFKGPKLAWTVRDREAETLARRFADNIIFETE